MSQPTDVTAILAIGETLLREALSALLSKHGVKILSTAQDSPGAIRRMRSLHPRVAILDQFLPILNGADTAVKTLHDDLEPRSILLCRTSTLAVQRALRAGVPGCVCVSDSVALVLQALKTVAEGGTFFCPEFSLHTDVGRLDRLTHRETEVLQLIAEGKSSKEISAILHISIKTTEHYRSRLMEKLDKRSVAQLTRIAIEEGLL